MVVVCVSVVGTERVTGNALQFFKEGFSARQGGLGLSANLRQTLCQEVAGCFDQRQHIAVGAQVLGARFLDEALKRRNDRCNRGNSCRMGAALESV